MNGTGYFSRTSDAAFIVVAIAALSGEMSISIQHQNAEFRIGGEFGYSDGLAAQDPFGVVCRVSPTTEPYNLWRRPAGCGEIVEIGVGGRDDEVSCLCEVPNCAIWEFEQTKFRNMCRSGV